MKTNLNFALLASSVRFSHWYCSAPSVRFQLSLAAALPLREPERVEHDEQRVAPLPGVVVLQQAGLGMLRRVAGVEAVGNGIREIPLPHHVRPDGQAVGVAAAPARAFAVVVAQHEEQRRGTAELAEVVPLGEILPGGVLAVVVLLGHERVAEVDVEIRARRPGRWPACVGTVGARCARPDASRP